MKPSRSVYVAGGAITPFIGKFHPDFIWKGHPEFGKKENPTIEAMIHQVAQQTLADTDVDGALIDRGVIGNFVGECFVNQGHLGAMLAAADPGFHGKPFHRVEGACASGGLALFSGIEAIACGGGVRGGDGLVAESGQRPDDLGSHIVIVFEHQDRLARTLGGMIDLQGLGRFWRLVGAR